MLTPVGPFRRVPGSSAIPMLSPLQVVPGPILYVDSRPGFGLAGNDGDPLAAWPDQSGFGNDFAQTAAALQPSYLTSAPSPTGAPLVRFTAGPCATGADDRLDCFGPNFGVGAWPSLANGWTVYAWVRRRQRHPCIGISPGASNELWGGGTGRPKVYLDSGTVFGPDVLQPTAQDTTAGSTGFGDGVQTVPIGTGVRLTYRFPAPDGQPFPDMFLNGANIGVFNEFWVAQNPALADGLFLGAQDTTTPALPSGRGVESDLGCFVFFREAHTARTISLVNRWMQVIFG